MAHVINQQKEVLVAAGCRWRDRATDVAMDELDGVRGATTRLLGEGGSPLLAGEAGVAHLIHLLQGRQPAHHLMAGELAQQLEAQMPKSSMLAPRRFFALGRQAHRSANLEVEDVEARR
jgi:hypothetical protein